MEQKKKTKIVIIILAVLHGLSLLALGVHVKQSTINPDIKNKDNLPSESCFLHTENL